MVTSNKIFVIAGHWDKDPGATANNLKEADLTKVIRDLVVEAIRQLDSSIEVIKDDDRDNLNQVISKVKEKANKGDLLIDIHYNAANPLAKGVECFVADNANIKSIKVAEEICDIISSITGTPNRGVKRESTTRHKRLGILHSKASSVLIELEFITNKEYIEYSEKWKHWISLEIATILVNNLK